MKNSYFENFDFAGFWDDREYSIENYIEHPPTDELIISIEDELGYKLPASYIALMKLHNGGLTTRTCFPTSSNSWAEDHIQIEGIMGIGREKIYSLCGELGSTFFTGEGGYPDIGICICDTPSAGHTMVMLDYTKCGKMGEPEVVYVDGELERITFLAKDFETFIKGLVTADVYDTSEQDLEVSMQKLNDGEFSEVLKSYFKSENHINFDRVLRNLLIEITTEKGCLALHNDSLSNLAYDIQFYLLTANRVIISKQDFIDGYLPMIALSDSDISLGGYANYFEEWYDDRISNNDIIRFVSTGMKFNDFYEEQMFTKVKKYL